MHKECAEEQKKSFNLKSALIEPQFTLTHRVVGAGAGIPSHFHPEHRISYVLRGRHACRFGQGVREFAVGDVGFINPYQSHEDLPSSVPYEYLTLAFGKEFLIQCIYRCLPWVGGLPQFQLERLPASDMVIRTCQAIREELDGSQPGRETVIRCLATELGVYAFRMQGVHEVKPQRHDGPRLVSHKLRVVLEYLLLNYMKKYDLRALSEMAGMSHSYLVRTFKRTMGVSPRTFIIKLRVDRSKQLLASTSKPIAEIALDLGFHDQSHFANVFRRFVSMTPGAFRETAK